MASVSDDLCKVCNEQSFGFHFNASTCRACSAFFRRTISTDKKYRCYRKGQCRVENRTVNCRACRLAKCFKAGMRAELVQNRPPIMASEQAPAIISEPRSQRTVIEKMHTGVLNYNNQQRSLFKILHPDKNPEDFNMVTYKENMIMERGCSSLILSMLSDYFPAFTDFDTKFKKDIFRSVFRHFTMFFATYQTMITFKDPSDWRFLLHYGQVLDCKRLDVYHRDDPNPIVAMRQSLAVGFCCVNLMRRMRELKLQEFEMAALFGVKLFNEVAIASPLHAKFAAEQRNLIYKCLFAEIERKHHSMAGVRFGSILLLLDYVEPIVKQLMENEALGRIFNVYSITYPDD